MKKLLSMLLAVSMLLAMGSGMVLFGANAEMAKMAIPGFDAFTLDELGQFAVTYGKVEFAKEDDKTIVNVGESGVDNYGYHQFQIWSSTGTDQWAKNPRINGKSFFGNVDLSNKAGFKFKVVNTGAEGTVPFSGEISFFIGGSARSIAVDYKGVYPDAEGYYNVDFSILGTRWGKEFLATDWFSDCGDMPGTYYMGLDIIKMTFIMEEGAKYSFYFDDFHAYGNADTVALGEMIQEAKVSGIVSGNIIADAEKIYKDVKSTQEQVDEIYNTMKEIIESEASAYNKAKDDLNGLLDMADSLGFFDDPSVPQYDAASEADLVYSDPDSTLAQLREQIAIIRLLVAKEVTDEAFCAVLEKAQNAWEYNYTKNSYAALNTAIDEAWENYDADADAAKTLIEDAYVALVAAPVRANTGNFFDGWTTEDVNAVVEANSEKLCDSIGDSLNTDEVWNAGDFSNNTLFEADNNFSITALADFENAMGWKNMDRSTNLGGVDNGAYPPLNVAGLSKADGIRFKLEATGSVERILIGLSNCSSMEREMYALNLKPEYVAADGYINVPFTYFEDAWWIKNSFSQDELEMVIVFIIEACGVAEGTTITVSDLTGYVNLGAASAEQKAKVATVLGQLKAFDIDNRYADVIASAEALNDDNYDADYDDAYAEIYGILESFKDPDAAVIDVPGFSVYSQFELDQFSDMDGGSQWIKGEKGVIYKMNKGGYAFANGIYVPGTGFEDSHKKDPFYGEMLPIGGKTFVDMLGGYKLADIKAFRFRVDGMPSNKWMGMNYKDGVGLWGGMASIRHDAYPDADGYFTYYTKDIKAGALGDWYGEAANTKENILNNTKFIACEFFEATGKEIYGWQVIMYDSIDRSELKNVLVALAGLDIEGYDDAMAVYYNTASTANDIAKAAKDLAANAVPAAPEAPTAAEVTDSSITLNAVEGLEYKIEGGEWTTNPVFEGLSANTAYTFYARVAANGVISASDATKVAITTLKTPLAGEAVIEGNAVYGETLTAVAVDSNAFEFCVDWYRDGKVFAKDAGFTYTLTKEDIGCSISAVLYSASFSGELATDATAVVAKATPVVDGEIEEVVVYIGEALETVSPAVKFDVEGTIAWETPEVVPALNQSGSTFKAVFTPADTDCYEVVVFDVVVVIDTDTELKSIIDPETGIALTGEFVKSKEVKTAFTTINAGESAYLAVLRAARDSEAENNLILFRNVAIDTDNAYLGSLTLTAEVGASRAGTEYTVWYFADGQVVSATGIVGADGVLVLNNVVVGVAK